MSSRKLVFTLMLVLSALLFTLLSAEVLIRWSGKYLTYSEKTKGVYFSYYNQTLPSWYFTLQPNSNFILDHGEFQYPYQTNTLGFREREVKPERDSVSIRVLFIGDSFTEGVGAPADSTLVRFAEAAWQRRYSNIEVFNFGVSGNDPVFGSRLLHDKLFEYQPTHLVFLCNYSDVEDVMFRGGKERFLLDGTTRFRSAPWFHPLYQYSHFFRFWLHDLCHYGASLLPAEMEEQRKKEALGVIFQTLKEAADSCNQRGIQFLAVLHPDPGEICMQLPRIKELSKQWHLQADFPFVNLYTSMQHLAGNQECMQIGWPVDGHYNASGYYLLAKALISEIDSLPTPFFPANDSSFFKPY